MSTKKAFPTERLSFFVLEEGSWKKMEEEMQEMQQDERQNCKVL
jgi:hypothetical protein